MAAHRTKEERSLRFQERVLRSRTTPRTKAQQPSYESSFFFIAYAHQGMTPYTLIHSSKARSFTCTSSLLSPYARSAFTSRSPHFRTSSLTCRTLQMSVQQAQNLMQTPNGVPTLMIANQGLGPFVTSAPARALLAVQGRNRSYNGNVVTAAKIATKRQPYVAALLIQSRGLPATTPCSGCSGLGQPRGRKAFPSCVRQAGHFGGACANCKWSDHAARCTVRDGATPSGGDSNPPDDDDSTDDSSDGESEWEGFDDGPTATQGSIQKGTGTSARSSAGSTGVRVVV